MGNVTVAGLNPVLNVVAPVENAVVPVLFKFSPLKVLVPVEAAGKVVVVGWFD